MNELIEDYQRKVNGVNELLKDKTNSDETINRLKIKVGCYRAFLTDLKRALNIDLVSYCEHEPDKSKIDYSTLKDVPCLKCCKMVCIAPL